VEILLNNNSDAGLRIVLPDDVTIINVNTEDIKGVGAGEIETADKDETGDYIYNARYYTDGTGYTDTDIDTLVLVIDVNDNVWHDAD
ncbi:MAG: hypothetical protein MR033_01955, partial [Clostridiales bacterium]|nr:hypothetical protein [Clostridiales bacterium]